MSLVPPYVFDRVIRGHYKLTRIDKDTERMVFTMTLRWFRVEDHCVRDYSAYLYDKSLDVARLTFPSWQFKVRVEVEAFAAYLIGLAETVTRQYELQVASSAALLHAEFNLNLHELCYQASLQGTHETKELDSSRQKLSIVIERLAILDTNGKPYDLRSLYAKAVKAKLNQR